MKETYLIQVKLSKSEMKKLRKLHNSQYPKRKKIVNGELIIKGLENFSTKGVK